MVDPALAVHERSMRRAKSEALKLKAAMSVLDRAGLPKGMNVSGDIGLDALAEILRKLPEEAAERLARMVEERG